MEREAYNRCQQALDEAYEILDTVSTTHSLPIAAAACRRALRVCFLLDQELNGAKHPPDFAATASLGALQTRYPRLFEHESILHPSMILLAVEWNDEEYSLGANDPETELERVFLPAARAIRIILDEVSTGLRNPARWGWRNYTALVAVCIVLCTIPWIWMMRSREGLTVTYFHSMNLKRPVARVVEKKVSAFYGESMFSVFKSRFSARWEGTLVVPVTTNYSFFCQSQGGVRLIIDDAVVLDNWRKVSWKYSGKHGEKFLKAGNHSIIVEYFKDKGPGALRLRWAGGPVPENTTLATPFLKR